MDRLVEIGLAVAEAMHRQATEPDALPVFTGDLALAFSRVSRAIRLTLIQAQRLHDGLPDVSEETEADAAVVPAQVFEDFDPNGAEHTGAERGEREETAWLRRPLAALAAKICDDLDTPYDEAAWRALPVDGRKGGLQGLGAGSRQRSPDGAERRQVRRSSGLDPSPNLYPSTIGTAALVLAADGRRPPYPGFGQWTNSSLIPSGSAKNTA